MLKCAMPAIGSLLFMLLLLFVYNFKPRYASIENKIFRTMISILTLATFLEIISFITMRYRETFPVVNEMFCRMSWLLGIMWIAYLCTYIFCLGWNYSATKITDLPKVHWKFKIIYVVTFITMTVFCMLPFEYRDLRENSYLTGAPCYLIYVVGLIMMIFIIAGTIKNRSGIPKSRQFQLYFIIVVTMIVMPLQVFFPHLSMYSTCFALEMYILYFSLENPDLFLIEELEKAKKIADESNSAKSDFLSNMSHEIRSPMNAIIGFSESILAEKDFNEELTKRDINSIRMAGNGLIDIINNILDISKIENGKESLNLSEYTIKDIIFELVSIIEARIGTKKIKFIVEIDKNIPSKMYGDKTKLYQILLNLLTNAVKYTEVGKIFLKIKGEKVSDDKFLLHLTVSDTGFGIKKEDYDKLFNKFVRLDSAVNNDIEGTGLGLVITKRLVNLLNGNITFDSEYGVGTTFNVDIEQKIVDFRPLENDNDENMNNLDIEYIDCTNYNILLVDDNRLNLKVIERLLQPYKFNITSVTTGKDCIYKVKEGIKYDMIFLDHMMPGMDGIEVLHVLKKLDGYEIPVIVALTANAITGMKDMYLKEGFNEYLAKPVNLNELNKVIIKYFKK